MDELALIFAFVLIICSISLGVGSWFYKQHIGYKERRDAMERERQDGGSNATITRLEDRVRVLERLATDRGQDLASEIEDLRKMPNTDLASEPREKVQ